jgi:hypothetical protein
VTIKHESAGIKHTHCTYFLTSCLLTLLTGHHGIKHLLEPTPYKNKEKKRQIKTHGNSSTSVRYTVGKLKIRNNWTNLEEIWYVEARNQLS